MTGQGDRNTGEILRTLLRLSVPTVVEQVMSTLMQYVDTAMVGRLGEQATAAVSTTTTITWLLGSIMASLGTAALALTARANGEGNYEAMRTCSGQAAVLTLVSGGVLTGICLFLSPLIPVWMGSEEAVRPMAARYFFILSLSNLPRGAAFVFGALIRATKDTGQPMRISLASNLMNVVLNGILIYGFGMGVEGAAIASALSHTAAGTAMFLSLRKNPSLRFGLSDCVPDRRILAAYGRIGIPAAATNAVSCLGYIFFAGMVSGMGTVVFAAHSIAVTAEELFYIPGYGLRTAASALIGNALGEGDEEKLRVTETLSIGITLLFMLAGGFILYLTADPLMRIFTSSGRVALLGAEMLRLVAFTEPFFGLMVVLEGIFYGKGLTRGVFFVESGSMWGIRILLTFLCVKVWGLGLREVWYCMIADNVCKAACLSVLYAFHKKYG